MLTPAGTVVATFMVGGFAETIAQSLGHQAYLTDSRLSLNAYRDLWHDQAVRASLPLTFRVAFLSTLTAATLGVVVAMLLRDLGRSRTWVANILQSTIAVPHIVGALCMLLLFSQSGFLSRLVHALGLSAEPATFPQVTNDAFGWSIIAEYVWKETPFLTLIVLASLAGLREREDVARTLGAGTVQRFLHVTLPAIAPSLAAGSVLVFAYAANAYEVPSILGRPYPATLPVVSLQLFTSADLTSRPEAMAAAVMSTVLTCAIVALCYFALARCARRLL